MTHRGQKKMTPEVIPVTGALSNESKSRDNWIFFSSDGWVKFDIHWVSVHGSTRTEMRSSICKNRSMVWKRQKWPEELCRWVEVEGKNSTRWRVSVDMSIMWLPELKVDIALPRISPFLFTSVFSYCSMHDYSLFRFSTAPQCIYFV